MHSRVNRVQAAREPERQHQAVGGQAPLATGLTPIRAKSWQP
jgi:hypothetical protein